MSELIKTATSILFFYFLHFRFLYHLISADFDFSNFCLVSACSHYRGHIVLALLQETASACYKKSFLELCVASKSSEQCLIFPCLFIRYTALPFFFFFKLIPTKIGRDSLGLAPERLVGVFQPPGLQKQIDVPEPNVKTWIPSKYSSHWVGWAEAESPVQSCQNKLFAEPTLPSTSCSLSSTFTTPCHGGL